MIFKKDLAEIISNRTGIQSNEVKRIIEEVFDQITSFAAKGDSVQIVGFGTFSSRIAKPRLARNPKTGETFNTLEHNKIAFTPSSSLKERVK